MYGVGRALDDNGHSIKRTAVTPGSCCDSGTRWTAAREDKVGTRPESVVNRRGSWGPFRGGETNAAVFSCESPRGACCGRKKSSIVIWFRCSLLIPPILLQHTNTTISHNNHTHFSYRGGRGRSLVSRSGRGKTRSVSAPCSLCVSAGTFMVSKCESMTSTSRGIRRIGGPGASIGVVAALWA